MKSSRSFPTLSLARTKMTEVKVIPFRTSQTRSELNGSSFGRGRDPPFGRCDQADRDEYKADHGDDCSVLKKASLELGEVLVEDQGLLDRSHGNAIRLVCGLSEVGREGNGVGVKPHA